MRRAGESEIFCWSVGVPTPAEKIGDFHVGTACASPKGNSEIRLPGETKRWDSQSQTDRQKEELLDTPSMCRRTV